MAKRKTSSQRSVTSAHTRGNNSSERELIVMARGDLGLHATATGIEAFSGRDVRGLVNSLERFGGTIQPLFGPTEERVRATMADLPDTPEAAEIPDLALFYSVSAPDEQLDDLADALRNLDEVEAAYVKPKGEPPVEDFHINDMPPRDEEAPSQTPDFTARQIYLNPAPVGIDARYAWRFPGGHGAGVRIIDCEWGWRFTHEDLSQNQGGIVVGNGISDDNHGTAVLGEYSGDRNAFGVVGISSDATASAASFALLPTATVIRRAADRLRAGDILLLEIHRSGPGASGVGQDGYIAVEWWPDDFAAIQYAVARGILVVEAAGNGARNLDDAIYDRRPQGFPHSWTNPFNPGSSSSGAIVVGAGAPPPGTHGRDHGPDRSRLNFSNYGRRVDAQGWGREVTTCGYGELQGGSNRDLWYTDQFSGTSSASPIIVGALACLQGILRARNEPLLSPSRARQLLRSGGSAQQDAPGRPRTQRIGNRPNLRQLIPQVLGLAPDEEFLINGRGELVAEQNGRVVINVNTPHVLLNIGQ